MDRSPPCSRIAARVGRRGMRLEDDVRVKVKKAPMRVARKSSVAAFFRQRRLGFVVDSEVEHSVHHARHRYRGARPHRHEQRTRPAAETPSGPFFQPGDASRDLILEARRRRVPADESSAGAGCDHHGRRDVEAKRLHPGDRPRLAPDQFAVRRPFAVQSDRPLAESDRHLRSGSILLARAASGARDLREARTKACDSSRFWRR